MEEILEEGWGGQWKKDKENGLYYTSWIDFVLLKIHKNYDRIAHNLQ